MKSAVKQERIADLRSLGLDPRHISEFNDAEELERLADLLKQSLIEEYKTAYSQRGAEYEDEVKATLTKF